MEAPRFSSSPASSTLDVLAAKWMACSPVTTFTQGFDKLQQAIVNMAEQAAAQHKDSSQQKRQTDLVNSGYNTRNKELRPLYNNDPAPPQKKPKKKASKPQAAAGKPP